MHVYRIVTCDCEGCTMASIYPSATTETTNPLKQPPRQGGTLRREPVAVDFK